jgi:dihydroneopterin aldolase
MGKIYLKGIAVYAFHGCLEEESKIGSEYEINLMVKTNLEASSKSDNLKDTINYVMLFKIVKDEMKKRSALLENVTDRIINKIMSSFQYVSKVEVEVSKKTPPIGGNVKEVSVKIKKSR